MGQGKYSLILWLGFSFLVSLCPWATTFTSTSHLFLPPPCYPLLSWIGRLEGAKVGYSSSPIGRLPPGQLGCNKIVSLEDRQRHSWVKQARVLWAYFKIAAFPIALLEVPGYFSLISPWEPSGGPGGKIQEYKRALLRLGPQEFLSLGLVHKLSFQQLVISFRCSHRFHQRLLLPVSYDSLYSSLFPVFGVVFGPVTSTFWWTKEEWLIFSLFSIFSCCEDGNDNNVSWIGNWESFPISDREIIYDYENSISWSHSRIQW